MKDEGVLDTYASFRRSVINHLKRLIKERDEAKISTIFPELSKINNELVSIFVEHNKELCLTHFDDLLNTLDKQDYKYEQIKEEIFFRIDRAKSGIELTYYLIIYITVEEFNKQLRQIQLPYDKILDEEVLTQSVSHMSSYYRGQTQGWPITPSILRSLKENLKIDKEGLMHLYEVSELNKKYNEMYCDYISQHYFYYRVALMQHACAFSPFIDFTKKPVVATSFSLSNQNQFNIFNSERSYVYKLLTTQSIKVIIGKQEASEFLEKINYYCIHINDDFMYGKIYQYDEYVGGLPTKKSLVIYTPLQLYNALKPKLVIIDSPTNDRMKYQSGVFVFFYDYISFKGELKYYLSSGFSIMKYPINPKSKRKILRIIHDVSEGWYESSLLSNPYEIFGK